MPFQPLDCDFLYAEIFNFACPCAHRSLQAEFGRLRIEKKAQVKRLGWCAVVYMRFGAYVCRSISHLHVIIIILFRPFYLSLTFTATTEKG